MNASDEGNEFENGQTDDVKLEQAEDVSPEHREEVETAEPGGMTPDIAKTVSAGVSKAPFVAFWLTASVFVLLIAFIGSKQLIPLPNRIQATIAVSGVAVLTILAIVLIVTAARAKILKGLRRAFLLAGISAVGMPVCAILHNVFYAVLVKCLGPGILDKLGAGKDEPVFFLLAVIVFPVLFVLASIYILFIFALSRRKKAK